MELRGVLEKIYPMLMKVAPDIDDLNWREILREATVDAPFDLDSLPWSLRPAEVLENAALGAQYGDAASWADTVLLF